MKGYQSQLSAFKKEQISNHNTLPLKLSLQQETFSNGLAWVKSPKNRGFGFLFLSNRVEVLCYLLRCDFLNGCVGLASSRRYSFPHYLVVLAFYPFCFVRKVANRRSLLQWHITILRLFLSEN